MTLTRTKLYLIALLLTPGAYAQDSSDQEELNQFLELLEQQTDLATETRINADFVPGMFSVLESEQLQRRGFRTLWQALASIPGVRATHNETGMRSISVRGLGGIFEPSKVKLLLNGKALNASAGATTGTLFDTPVSQIERIEFVRGPGSAIHGEFAYAGVVNVITRQQGEQYSAGIEAGDAFNFAALYSFGEAGDDFRGSLNVAANEAEGEDISSGLDRTAPGIPSYAPGPINNKRDFFSAIVDLESGSLNALIQLQQGNRGDYFGTNNLLPPDVRQTVISDTVISADLSQSFDIDGQLSGNWSVNLLKNSSKQNSLFLGVAENFGGLGTEDDIIADSLLEERRLEARTNLLYAGAEHKIFAELVATEIEVTASEQFINLVPGTNLPSPTLNEFPAAVDESQDRSSISLVLQDEFMIDDRLTLTSGLRFDNYEDIGSHVSPRVALVWRRSDEQIFKVQLAHAFKPPSLLEVGGSLEVSIEPETNDTLEFGHIYHRADLVLRNTLYFSKLDNLIEFQDFVPYGYKNSGSFNLRGYELEAESRINNDWEINASLSLQDYAGEDLAGAAPWMIKLGAEYRLLPLTSAHFQISSNGGQNRLPADPRGRSPRTNQVDLTLLTRNFLDIGGLNFRWGIMNLLGENLEQSAPPATYPEDYPYSDGALLWAQFVYQP